MTEKERKRRVKRRMGVNRSRTKRLLDDENEEEAKGPTPRFRVGGVAVGSGYATISEQIRRMLHNK